jgi:hypothetical protein
MNFPQVRTTRTSLFAYCYCAFTCSSLVWLPSLPSWPKSLEPQVKTSPRLVSIRVWRPPGEILATYITHPSVQGLECTQRLKGRGVWRDRGRQRCLKRNDVTRYRFSHLLRAITIKKNDNVSYEPRAVTIRSNKDFHKPRAIKR